MALQPPWERCALRKLPVDLKPGDWLERSVVEQYAEDFASPPSVTSAYDVGNGTVQVLVRETTVLYVPCDKRLNVQRYMQPPR